jgi:enoyl-CoA hydratase
MGLLPRAQRLLGRVGPRALPWLLDGALLPYDEQACAVGLLDELVSCDEADWMGRAMEWAGRFASPDRSGAAIGALKLAARAAWSRPLEQGVALERELRARLLQTDDAAEGLDAWLEGRAPRFSGR